MLASPCFVLANFQFPSAVVDLLIATPAAPSFSARLCVLDRLS